MAGMFDSWNQGVKLGREERQQRIVGQNIESAMGGDQGALGQILKASPDAGMQVRNFLAQQQKSQREQQDTENQHVGKLAAAFAQTRDPMLWKQLHPALVQRGAPADMPADLTTPEDLDGAAKAAQSFAMVYGGMEAQNKPAAVQELEYLLANPQARDLDMQRRQAGWQPKVLETADGYSVFDPQTRGAQPLSYERGPVRYQTDDGQPIPESELAIVEQAMEADRRGEAFYMPVGGERVMPPSKPGGGKAAPSGYQWSDDGKRLVPIPGGPADRKNNPLPSDLAKGEMALRKELDGRLKNQRTVTDMYQKVQAAASTPSAANDLALIFAYMKMLDPGSVVREQEFANAQNAAGVPDRVRNAYNKALRGERLNEDQRRTFVQSASQIFNVAQQETVGQTRQYAEMAEAYGYDPVRSTGSKMASPQFRQQYDKAGQLLQEAREAIKSGRDPQAVKRRLMEMGYSNIAGRL